ncbi:MAG TPA: glycosyltransferase family 2 protein [Candidatus Woesebacteria bacterium]|jgi:GT2 family glycosyltransferase|nr:glycosyltransferase family 2 protein [Candidatus Shapirobacteria bacterium]HOR01657.1 glycosyltransferase family 2 protein [Candidatus Woesebacteria bacterium]
MTPTPNYSIIIPNYNGSAFIPDCLKSIFAAVKNCPQNQFEIILVDNNSHDHSPSIFKDFFSQNKLSHLQSAVYYQQSNTGFAAAINYGINHAACPYVVVTNNDIVIKPDWFQIVSKVIVKNKTPKVSTFFGTILTRDGTRFESQGLKFYPNGRCHNLANGQKYLTSKLPQNPQVVWGASAALAVYPKKIIQSVGLFDSDFFAYEEDVDMALRFHKLGYQTIYVPQAISYHWGGATSKSMGNFRHRMDAKNWIYIIIKNYSSKEIQKNFWSIFVERLRNLSYLIKQTLKIYRLKSIFYLPFDIIRTYGEVIINFPTMIQKRRHIQKMIKYSH